MTVAYETTDGPVSDVIEESISQDSSWMEGLLM